MNGLIIYTVGVLLVGLGFGFCWGWADGRRKLRAELDHIYRERIATMRTTGTVLYMNGTEIGSVSGHVDVGQPLYNQEHER